MSETLLEIRGLKTWFRTDDGMVRAVDGVSLSVDRGETLAVVGESGCGKTVTARSVLKLIDMPPGRFEAGQILWRGRDLIPLGPAEMDRVRAREIGMVFQEPMTSLNPVYTVGDQIAESLRAHERISRRAAMDGAVEMLRLVQIPNAERRVRDYPHQFSGGMRQRVMIRMPARYPRRRRFASSTFPSLGGRSLQRLLTKPIGVSMTRRLPFPLRMPALVALLFLTVHAAAQTTVAPAIAPKLASELPPNHLVLPTGSIDLVAGPHEVDVVLDGQPARLRYQLRSNAAQDELAPLVVSLSAELDAAPTAVVLAPVCPAGHTWAEPSTQAVLGQLIDGIVAGGNVDADRVYLVGVGPAASSTWQAGAALANRLAAVAAFDVASPVDPAATVESLWHVGIYAVFPHAARPLPMVSALADRPHRDYSLHLDPDGNAAAAAHVALADPNFWGWMFAHHRSDDTTAPPPVDPKAHHGSPTIFPTTTVPVAISFDHAALPNKPGYAVVPGTLHLGDKMLPFDFGVYLPPGYPHAVGYGGGPVATVVNLHWREFFGGSDSKLLEESLPRLIVRTGYDDKHRGERPSNPVPLFHVAPVICLMPHCPANCRFEWTPGMAEAIGQLIDQVVPALHADPDRVFLTGLSYGGSASWIVGEHIASRIAGIIPCDGRRTVDPAATAAALHDVAIYISAGDVDGDFTNDARWMSAALAAADHPNVTYREIHGGNHFCYSATYTDPAFWSWLEDQHRPHQSMGSTAASR